MLHYCKINATATAPTQPAHTAPTQPAHTAPTQPAHTAPTIRIHQPDDNQNLVCFKTGSEQLLKVLLCGYNCFISDENREGQRADIIINDTLCLDNLRLGGVYLNVNTKPNSRYLMAFPYGNHTSIIDVSAGEKMYVNRENFVACHISPELTVEKAYGVTTRNSDAAKLLLNKERWLRVGKLRNCGAMVSTPLLKPGRRRSSYHSQRRSSHHSQRRLSTKNPTCTTDNKSLGGNPSYSIALGGHSQLSLVKLEYNSIQVDDDNVVAVIGDLENIDVQVIHSAQKKNSLTGTTVGRAGTGERTGEGIHFNISYKDPEQRGTHPIYVVLQGNVYGHTEVIADIHAHASSNNSGGNSWWSTS